MPSLRNKIKQAVAKLYFHPQTLSDTKYQEKLRSNFITKNIHTQFGKTYQFSAIKTIADFQKNIPISSYDQLQPYIEHMLQ